MSLQVVYPVGGVVAVSADGGEVDPVLLSAESSQDDVTVAGGAGALQLELPADAEIGQLKKVVTVAIAAGTTCDVVPPAGATILSGTTVVASASVAEADVGAELLLQHQVSGTWRILQISGVVTLA